MKAKVRLSVCLLLSVFCLSLSAQQADKASVTLDINNGRIIDCIRALERQTSYTFLFTDDVDIEKSVSVSIKNESLERALEKVFGRSETEYEIEGSQIILKKKDNNAQPASAQRIVSGLILGTNNEPVPGAAILKSDGTGTISDLDGRFSIGLRADETMLSVRCLGYMDKVVSISPKSNNLTVKLEDDALSLEGTVVVGYGVQKKVNLTGAISTVSSENLENRVSPTLSHMLQGSVPGLNITTSSGRPGNTASINIRGVNSINGGSPLVLVDGAEGSLETLNPNDVESISVIKDASSAAIYGARASFGVILVSTKNGADTENATVRYSGRMGWTAPTVSTDYETRGYYSVYINDLFWRNRNGNNYSNYTTEDMEQLWLRRNDRIENPQRPWVMIDQRTGRNTYVYYANTDWYHYLFTDVNPLQSHNVSVSGGSKHIKYFISGNYDRQEGIFRENTDVVNKYNFRIKLTADINKWAKISNNTSYYSYDYTYPGPSGVNTAFSLGTVHALASYPTQNPDGSSIYYTSLSRYGVMDGLLTILDKGKHTNTDIQNRFTTTTELTLTPAKGLQVIANFTYMHNQVRSNHRAVNTTYSTYPGEFLTLNTGRMEDYVKESLANHNYYQANLYATYQNSINEEHNFKVMGGFNYETKKLKDFAATGYYMMTEALNDLALLGTDADGNRRTDVSGGFNEYVLEGLFGRFNYDYKGKYLFELSGRFDGSSRFAKGHRWGVFPSASAGWRISEEPFFQPVRDWWDNLKIRYSYGKLGNQQVGYYDYIRTISIGSQSYLFGGDKSIVASISAPVASDLTWEAIHQNNLGVDMAFLQNRLTFTGEGYIRDTKDMLTAGIALPSTYGASSPKMNSADLRTMGYELQLGWRDGFKLLGDTFSYSANLSFSDYTSTITKFDNPDRSFAKTYYEGMRWGEIWGYHVDGFFKTDEEAANYPVDQTIVNQQLNQASGIMKGVRAGDLKFVDLDGDNKISIGKDTVDDPGDRRVIGNSTPRYQYGLNLAARWYGVDFSIFFQGIGRCDWYPASNAMLFWGPFARPYATWMPRNFHQMYWTEENPDAYFPRPRAYEALNGGGELVSINDKYIQNIGYCRLKNLSVGYTIPQKWSEKAGIKSLRVYFSGENLAYMSGIHSDYIDPEHAMTGGNLRIYPWTKTYTFGLDLTF